MKKLIVMSAVLIALMLIAVPAFALWEELPINSSQTTTLYWDLNSYEIIVPDGPPQQVTIETKVPKAYQKGVRTYLFTPPIEGGLNIIYDGLWLEDAMPGKVSGKYAVYKRTYGLQAGKYYFYLTNSYVFNHPDFGVEIYPVKNVTISTKATPMTASAPLAFDDESPSNGIPKRALPMTLGAPVNGFISSGDRDFYHLGRLDNDGKYQFSLKQYNANLGFIVYRVKPGADVVNEAFDRESPNYGDIFEPIYVRTAPTSFKKATTFKSTVLLPGGDDYYIEILNNSKDSYKYSHYDMLVEFNESVTITKLSLPSTMTLAVGVETPIPLQMVPYYFPSREAVKYTSSKPDVCRVKVDDNGAPILSDAGLPVLEGLSPGTAKITVSNAANEKIKATCTVTVNAKNEFKRSKPLTGKGKLVFASTKSLKYVDDKLVCEIFINNKTSKKVTPSNIRYSRLALYHMNLNSYGVVDWYNVFTGRLMIFYQNYNETIGSINFKSVAAGKYGVLTWTIDTNQYPELKNLNLASGEYNAVAEHIPESGEALKLDSVLRYGKSLHGQEQFIVPVASGKNIKGATTDYGATIDPSHKAR